MWDVGRLRVHEICSRRLVYMEVVEARSNCKQSYLWGFKIPACGDSTRSNLIEREWVRALPGLVWGKEWCDLVCVECV